MVIMILPESEKQKHEPVFAPEFKELLTKVAKILSGAILTLRFGIKIKKL